MRTAYINITLTGAELRALIRMAKTDCRPMREQIRYLFREEARKRDLLPEQKSDRLVVQPAT